MRGAGREKSYDPQIMDQMFCSWDIEVEKRMGNNIDISESNPFQLLSELQKEKLDFIARFLEASSTSKEIKRVVKLKNCSEKRAGQLIREDLKKINRADPRVVLTPQQKLCLAAYHYSGRATFAEVGTSLGISRKTVKKHIDRAVEKIRKHVMENKGELFEFNKQEDQ